jgi:hypothetical protein
MTLVNDVQKDGEYTNHLHGDLPNVFSWQDVDVERTRIELDRGKKNRDGLPPVGYTNLILGAISPYTYDVLFSTIKFDSCAFDVNVWPPKDIGQVSV